MVYHPPTAYESTATMLAPDWGAILSTALAVVATPVVTLAVLTDPSLGFGVGVGLLLGSAVLLARGRALDTTGDARTDLDHARRHRTVTDGGTHEE